MNQRELSTVLAALRYWQRDLLNQRYDILLDDERIVDIATNYESFEPLTVREIDELCESLNQMEVA